MNQQAPTRADLWKQYEIDVGLYKHYLDRALKFNVFYYAITGAILSFYLSRPQPPGALRYSLLLLIRMGAGLAGICIYGGFLNLNTREQIKILVAALGLPVYPEFIVLSIALWLSGAFFLIVMAGIFVLFLCPNIVKGYP